MSVLFCRLCAGSEPPCKLLDFSRDTPLRTEIVQNLLNFSSHGIDFVESLPEAICTNCRDTLRVCCIFLKNIRHAQGILRDYRLKGLFVKKEICSDSEIDNEGLESGYNFQLGVEVPILFENGIKQENTFQEIPAVYQPNSGESVSRAAPENLPKIKTEKVKNDSFNCNDCDESFPTVKELFVHTSTNKDPNHTKKRQKLTPEELTCNVCNKLIHGRSKFNTHKLIHLERTRDFKCDECTKSFFTAQNLRAHKATHKSDPQPCPICNKVFQNTVRLRSHIKTHSVNKFECDICHHMFRNKGQIATHMIIHSNKLPFICKFCGKGFHFKVNLKNHENVHKKEKPFTCTECGQKFTMWSNCNKHMKRIHGRSLAKTMKTPLGKVPINQATGEPLKMEIKMEHDLKIDIVVETEVQGDFTCDGCGKMFLTRETLLGHRRIAHGKYEAQVCKICNAQLSNWDNLEKHMKKHKGETFECDHCHYVFTTKMGIRRHMLVHTDLKPFRCDHCGKGFKRSNHLKLHLGIHGIKT